MLTAFLIGLVAQQGGVAAAPPPPPELKVVVAAPVYHPDAAVSGESATLAGGVPSVLYVFSRRSICDTATRGATEPADAGFGWRVASHVVSASASDVIVSVDWRRMWDRGQKVNDGPAGTVQLTLHPGDRIPLDHIPNVKPTDACRAVGMGLEMRLGRAAGSGRPGVTPPLGAREGGAGSLDVDLWLVHTTPAGSEQAQHQTVRLTRTGGPFTFAPVKFVTGRGEVGVELTGSFQRYTAASGGELLLISMSRQISGGTAPAGGLGGATSSLVALPRPEEVLSFDMATAGAGARGRAGGARSGGGGGTPVAGGGTGTGGPGQRSTGGGGTGGGPGGSLERLANALQAVALLDGHRFALRVRVTPVQ